MLPIADEFVPCFPYSFSGVFHPRCWVQVGFKLCQLSVCVHASQKVKLDGD